MSRCLDYFKFHFTTKLVKYVFMVCGMKCLLVIAMSLDAPCSRHWISFKCIYFPTKLLQLVGKLIYSTHCRFIEEVLNWKWYIYPCFIIEAFLPSRCWYSIQKYNLSPEYSLFLLYPILMKQSLCTLLEYMRSVPIIKWTVSDKSWNMNSRETELTFAQVILPV
jgi:hypothetical protein